MSNYFTSTQLISDLLLLGFIAIVYVLNQSIEETRYGLEVAKLLKKRRNILFVFVIIVLPIFLAYAQDILDDWFDLILICVLGLWWIQILISKRLLKPIQGDVLYQLEICKNYPSWFSGILLFSGLLFTGLSISMGERPFVISFLAILCFAGAIYLSESNQRVIQITALALRENQKTITWHQIKTWIWSEKNKEHHWLVIQRDGFASDLRIDLIKFPVEEVEKVDSILQTIAPTSSMTQIVTAS